MLKTYQSRFAGEYNGIRYRNKLYQTTDIEQQKKIEKSNFFTRGQITLLSTIDDTPEPVHTESLGLEGMQWGALKKKASEMGIKVARTVKKQELIQMIEQVS